MFKERTALHKKMKPPYLFERDHYVDSVGVPMHRAPGKTMQGRPAKQVDTGSTLHGMQCNVILQVAALASQKCARAHSSYVICCIFLSDKKKNSRICP